MGAGIGGHTKPNRGATDEWLTPPSIVQALGPFDLDPCSPVERPWATAARHLTVLDDGLAAPWAGRVWLNPPYGSQIDLWMAKLAAHGNGIALIFARTETACFRRHIWPKAAGLLFLTGRLYFHLPDGQRAAANSGGPSVLIAYGLDNGRALRDSTLAGAYVETVRWAAR